MIDPSVSVVIVNWNHGEVILQCLCALQAQDYPGLQVIVVDNASTDGSPEAIARQYPTVHLECFSSNRGFSAAFNAAAQQTTSDFVLSLNPDVFPRAGFVRELLLSICQHERLGMAAPKLLRFDDPRLLDSSGLFINRLRCPYDRGQGQPDQGQYDRQTNVFGACGAAALYRRAMLDDVAVQGEFMDEDFFAYYEDADLAWRAQLRGWHCVYVPAAVAAHVRGWGDTLRKRQVGGPDLRGVRLAQRNRYLMAAKNDELSYFAVDLPLILATESIRLAYAAVRAPAAWRGVADLLTAWPAALRKRRVIRGRCSVPDREIRRWMLAPDAISMTDDT